VKPVGVHIGLDLGGTNVKCAVLDPALRVVAAKTCPTGAADGPEAVIERVSELALEAAAPHGEILSAGLALPGHFDDAGRGVLLPNLAGDWAGRPIAGPSARSRWPSCAWAPAAVRRTSCAWRWAPASAAAW